MQRIRRPLLKGNLTHFGLVLYVREMKRLLKDCRTCLDVGCGNCSPTCYIDFQYIAGVDGHVEALAQAQNNLTHHDYVLASAQSIGKLFSPKQFDCCVALDLV